MAPYHLSSVSFKTLFFGLFVLFPRSSSQELHSAFLLDSPSFIITNTMWWIALCPHNNNPSVKTILPLPDLTQLTMIWSETSLLTFTSGLEWAHFYITFIFEMKELDNNIKPQTKEHTRHQCFVKKERRLFWGILICNFQEIIITFNWQQKWKTPVVVEVSSKFA